MLRFNSEDNKQKSLVHELMRAARTSPKKLLGTVGVIGLLSTASAYALQTPNSSPLHETQVSSTSGSFIDVQSSTSSPQENASPDSSSSIDLNVQSTSNEASSSESKVIINGQEVEVPENGTINQTIVSEDGNSTSNITVKNQSSSTSSTSNNSTVILESYSSSTGDSQNSSTDNSRHRSR